MRITLNLIPCKREFEYFITVRYEFLGVFETDPDQVGIRNDTVMTRFPNRLDGRVNDVVFNQLSRLDGCTIAVPSTRIIRQVLTFVAPGSIV